jgi:hypothetical protein
MESLSEGLSHRATRRRAARRLSLAKLAALVEAT